MNFMNVSVKKSLAVSALVVGLLVFLSGDLSLAQNIRVSNTSTNRGNGRYTWTIFIDASQADLDKIDFVQYYLYPIFDHPNRKVDKPRSGPHAFYTSDDAFRPANVQVIVFFRGQKENRSFNYTLRLRSSFAKSWYVVLGSFNLNDGGK